MVVLGGGAVSYERGTPVEGFLENTVRQIRSTLQQAYDFGPVTDRRAVRDLLFEFRCRTNLAQMSQSRPVYSLALDHFWRNS